MRAAKESDPAGSAPPTWRTMSAPARIGMVVVWVVAAVYLVLLLKLLLLSRAPGSERSLNLIPFASIANYLFSGLSTVHRFAAANVLGNVAAFVPFGAYLPLIRRRTGIGANLLIVIGTSVVVEVVQGVFGLGASDIDDVILNTLGGLIGILVLTLLRVLLRRWGRVIAVSAVLSLLALPVLAYLLLAVRLHM